MSKIAVIVVDPQVDFITGSLAVPGAIEALPGMVEVIKWARKYDYPVIVTQDDHPVNHCSFKENGGTFPTHCVTGTEGQEIHPIILHALVDERDGYYLLSKGNHEDREAFSGFEGTCLEDMLEQMEIDTVMVCGLATDYCVYETAKDALQMGFEVHIAESAIAGTSWDRSQEALADLLIRGAELGFPK